jgi:hypothetical protein
VLVDSFWAKLSSLLPAGAVPHPIHPQPRPRAIR